MAKSDLGMLAGPQMRIVAGKLGLAPPGGTLGPYERFTLSLNPDGSRSLRAVTRSPNGTLLRDVNLMVDARWRDIEGMTRLFVGGVSAGTASRRVIGERLHSMVWLPGTPIDTAEFDLPVDVQLGYHCVQLDAWKMNTLSTATEAWQPVRVHTVSQSWNGKSLGHGGLVESRSRFAGREQISVPAGRFDCDWFVWETSFGAELHVWRTGPLNVLAQMRVARTANGTRDGTLYQLTELDEDVVTTPARPD